MSFNRTILPELFQPRFRSHCSTFLNHLEQKDHFRISLNELGKCARVKVVALRILSALGTILFAAKDLMGWIYFTGKVVAIVGLKFHFANLISILSLPFIAMATMPFGRLPAQSYALTFIGRISWLEALLHSIPREQLSINNVAIILDRMVRCAAVSPEFFLEAVQKGYREIVEAAFQIPFANRDTILRQTLQLSIQNAPGFEKTTSTIVSLFFRNQTNDATSLDLQMLYEAMQAMDEPAIDALIESGVSGVGPDRISPFHSLILGTDDLDLSAYRRAKTARTAERAVRIAKKCIVAFGAFNPQHFEELKEVCNHLHGTERIYTGEFNPNNPYLSVLRKSALKASQAYDRVFVQRLQMVGLRILEIMPNENEFQTLQVETYTTKYKEISITELPQELIKLILRYNFQHTEAGEEAVLAASKSAIASAQSTSLNRLLVSDLEAASKLDPKSQDLLNYMHMLKHIHAVDEAAITILVQKGVDPCGPNPLERYAFATAFEHLILGVEDVQTYPMRKKERDIRNVVAIAKICIGCSGALNTQFFVMLVEQARHYPRALLDNIKNFKVESNPYYAVLAKTRVAEEGDNKMLFSQFIDRIAEICPHIDELERFQRESYVGKYRKLKELFPTIPRQYLRLILDYALLYSKDDEEFVKREEILEEDARLLERSRKQRELSDQVIKAAEQSRSQNLRSLPNSASTAPRHDSGPTTAAAASRIEAPFDFAAPFSLEGFTSVAAFRNGAAATLGNGLSALGSRWF